MLIIYRSNNLELFMRLVINIMSMHRLSNPMQPEIILVENKIIEKWIEIELSNYFGISANIAFMSIKFFIQNIFKDMLPNDCSMYDFSYDSMYWEFMNILPEYCLNNNCFIIQKYLYNDISKQKCGQLSMTVTSLFLEYLIYRSDWLNAWKTNKIVNTLKDTSHQTWQSEIWRMFIGRNMHHPRNRCNLLDYYIDLLKNNDKQLNYDNLPKRIFIYSVTFIPVIYWKILNLLSYKVDIYLWTMDPIINNKNYSFNKNSKNLQKKQDILYDNDMLQSLEVFREQYNLPVLNLWNDFAQENLYSLNQLKNFFVIKAFTIPKTNSMLHILQKDLLKDQSIDSTINLQKDLLNSKNIKSNRKRFMLDSRDQSITIHNCHHIYREIEVLHNNLLSILSDDSSLLPGDIIVMAPNIYCYKSAIKNIFNNLFNRQLPFSISGSFEYTGSVISSVFKILDFWCSRFTSEEILSFLSISSIISRFDMSIREIELIRIWTIESGIRWGLDQETMRIFDLPVTDQNTWFFGLKRMFLGYAMHNQKRLWKNIYPYDYVNEEYISIIFKLGNFFNTLKKWRDRLNRIYTLKEWIPFMQEIIDDFFDCTSLSEEENKILFLLKTYWIDILESGIQSGYMKKIGIVVLRDQLKFKFNKKRIDCRFLPNVINFCDIMPICCVPCKVLCIIGMNDEAFPRQSSLCDFNLILKEERYGDRNIRKRDCYEFLLMCLLPKERLYISFISNMDHYNDSVRDSSILIDELLGYIAQNFCLEGDQNLDVIDNLKSLRRYLFQQYSYTPFDLDNFIANTKTQSFAKEWLHSSNISNDNANDLVYFNNFSVSLPEVTNTIILFKDLYNFYRHPVKTWFQKRLGVYFYLNTYKKLVNDEPFCVNDVDRFLLNTKLIDYIIHNKNIDELYQESYASGMIPHGAFGKLYWSNEYERMNKLASQIKMYHFNNNILKLDIDLEFNTIRLIGKLNIVHKIGLIRWKAAHLNMKDCFLFWLEHLTYCAIGGKGESRLFGINSMWYFPNFSRIIAKKLLFILIDGYCSGMNIPLILLYRSGGVWINYMFDCNSKTIYLDKIQQEKARQQLIRSWQGHSNSSFSTGECHDPYLRKLIPFYLNEEDIQKITNTAKHYFLDVMRYRIS